MNNLQRQMKYAEQVSSNIIILTSRTGHDRLSVGLHYTPYMCGMQRCIVAYHESLMQCDKQ